MRSLRVRSDAPSEAIHNHFLYGLLHDKTARNDGFETLPKKVGFYFFRLALLTFTHRHKLDIFRSCVFRAWTNDFVVNPLLDDVRAPARCAGYHEQWGEHGGRYAHEVIRHRAKPVQVREHFFDVPHDGF